MWTKADLKKVTAKTKVPTIGANALTKHSLYVLDKLDFFVWRQNNGAVYDKKFGGYRKNSSTPGISDILGFHRKTGQILAAEIKAGKDVLSDDQERFLKAVERSGGIALVIRTIGDIEVFVKQCQKWKKDGDASTIS